MSSHKATERNQASTCKECGRTHNSLLHLPRAPELNKQQAPSPKEQRDQRQISSQPAPKNEIITGHLASTEKCFAVTEQTVLLPIIPVNMWNVQHTKMVISFALLDGGSTATFYSER